MTASGSTIWIAPVAPQKMSRRSAASGSWSTLSVSAHQVSTLLPAIHCPTLILVGEEDTLTPPALSEEMHRAIAGSELVVVPGAGHLSSFEQPDVFNSALARFLTHRV